MFLGRLSSELGRRSRRWRGEEGLRTPQVLKVGSMKQMKHTACIGWSKLLSAVDFILLGVAALAAVRQVRQRRRA